MRRTILAAAILALMVPTMGHADDADDESKIKALLQQHFDALIAVDIKALEATISDDYQIVGPFGDLMSKADYVKVLKDRSQQFLAMETFEVKVRVYGDAAVAISRH